MTQHAARCALCVISAAMALLMACAPLPTASEVDRFADAYIELLPVGALMAAAAARDAKWPLGEKASLVSAAQLGCMRQALSPAEINTAQRQLARDYAGAHPGTLVSDLSVLERGAARLIGQAMRQGAGVRDAAPIPPATIEETQALAAFATEPRYATLREATGLKRLAGGGAPGNSTQRGQDIARVLTVKFMTDAFLRCHIPVKLLY